MSTNYPMNMGVWGGTRALVGAREWRICLQLQLFLSYSACIAYFALAHSLVRFGVCRRRAYQFLALQIVVYWAIVAGHMASGFSPLIGIPLLPLLVVQIILLIHIWTNLVTKHHSPSDASSGL
ncbi:hypothetical protein ACTXT7_006708 [Hymenolepis weldensis]